MLLFSVSLYKFCSLGYNDTDIGIQKEAFHHGIDASA